MQLFPEFNETIGGRSFDADAFTIMLYLGGTAFCKFSGSTNLVFKKGNARRNTWLRMDLQENEGGFDRLKIHYQADETVRMEFYSLTTIPGMKSLKGLVTVVEDVKLDYMGEVFQEVTGLNMQGTSSA